MKKIGLLFLVIGIGFACAPSHNQNASKPGNGDKSYKVNTVAFYNVENLFDTIDDPNTQDEKSPIMDLDKDIRGEIYWKKNENMAKVIADVGSDVAKNAPVLVGLAEIENRVVLEDLVNDDHLKDGNYGIAHFDSPDYRGIDVALLYQKDIFHPTSTSAHEVVIYDIDNPENRYYTRDVLLVTGELDGDEMHVLVNHWPSRYGGEKRSRKNREVAAAVNKRLVDSLYDEDPKSKVIIMGDMNDGPYNSSMKNVLKAKANPEDVKPGGIYNPMENMLKKKGLGTIGYQDSWDLFDQILVNHEMLEKDYSTYRYWKAGIFNPAYLTNEEGRWKGYPFRSYADGEFTGGYSDHYPVYMYLIKEVNKEDE